MIHEIREFRLADHSLEEWQPEASSDYRRRLKHICRSPRERVDASSEDALNGGRHLLELPNRTQPPAPIPQLEQALIPERTHELFSEEWISARALEHKACQCGGRRTIQAPFDQRLHRRFREWFEGDAHEPIAADIGKELLRFRAARHVDQDRVSLKCLGEVACQCNRRRVGPMRILDRND